MIDLPGDVQFLILDLIPSKSDLKALCETSKACRELALPRLYHHIEIRSWLPFGLLLFVRCAVEGAEKHCRFVRHLTIEDCKPPTDPYTQQIALQDVDGQSRSDAEDPCPHNQIRVTIMTVLEMMTRNQLKSFR
jgi:hypothetical protein